MYTEFVYANNSYRTNGLVVEMFYMEDGCWHLAIAGGPGGQALLIEAAEAAIAREAGNYDKPGT